MALYNYAVTLNFANSYKYYNMKRDFYLDVNTILKGKLISSMDHMRISGNEPSLVILIQKVV